ncbi:hypothetical protein QOT17_024892 [Balamuthia mandrillaris]
MSEPAPHQPADPGHAGGKRDAIKGGAGRVTGKIGRGLSKIKNKGESKVKSDKKEKKEKKIEKF